MILHEMLESLLDGPLIKTHMAHKANLDTTMTNKYLKTLTNLKLVELKNDNLYSISANGHLYIQEFKKLSELVVNNQNHTVKIQ